MNPQYPNVTIIPLAHPDPGPQMESGQVAIKVGYGDIPTELLFKDRYGIVHSLTSDKTRIELIKKLICENVRIIRAC